MRLFCIICSFIIFTNITLAAEVISELDSGLKTISQNGNIFLINSKGKMKQLTSTGFDFDPSLSIDGHSVVFARKTPNRRIEGPQGLDEANEIWIIGSDGLNAKRVAEGKSSMNPKEVMISLQSPKISPDGRKVYFLSSAWATSGSVHGVDTKTLSVLFVTDGNSIEIIPDGKYKGYLIVISIDIG